LKHAIFAIRQDAARYGGNYLRSSGFWVTVSYRIRRLRKIGAWPCRLLLPADVILGLARWCISDTILPSNMHIGPGLFLPHPNGIIINPGASIGANASIFQQVTIGGADKCPTIQDNCALFAGAKVFGGIVIGHDSKIGANAVVRVDIPAFSTVSVEAPAMWVRRNSSSV